LVVVEIVSKPSHKNKKDNITLTKDLKLKSYSRDIIDTNNKTSDQDFTLVRRRKKRKHIVPQTARPMLTVEKGMRNIEKSREVELPKSFIMKVSEGGNMAKVKKRLWSEVIRNVDVLKIKSTWSHQQFSRKSDVIVTVHVRRVHLRRTRSYFQHLADFIYLFCHQYINLYIVMYTKYEL